MQTKMKSHCFATPCQYIASLGLMHFVAHAASFTISKALYDVLRSYAQNGILLNTSTNTTEMICCIWRTIFSRCLIYIYIQMEKIDQICM